MSGARRLRLETERLVVREYTLDDLDDVAAILADARVFWWRKDPYDRDGARAWLDQEIDLVERDGTGHYAVVLQATGHVIGGVGLSLRIVDGREYHEIGWHTAPWEWGRGYATEAARALLGEARSRGLRRVVSFITPANARSKAVARNLCMTHQGDIEWAGLRHELWALDLD